ncbi:hypothetical protein B0T12DRAFT_420412 [Alternaria alternata]|nr:hypothetical protein B0T12DRAFT_420412 [Alternaria alternata]
MTLAAAGPWATVLTSFELSSLACTPLYRFKGLVLLPSPQNLLSNSTIRRGASQTSSSYLLLNVSSKMWQM